MDDAPPKRPFRKRIKYTLIYWFTHSLIKLANVFPRTWVLRTTGALAGLAFYFFKEAREITIRNLSMVFEDEKTPEQIADLAKQVFVHLGKNAGDIIRALPINSMDKLERFVRIEGEEHLKAAAARGKGVIAVTAHLGAFEFVGSYLGLAGYRPLIIGTALKDERLNSMLVEQRENRGAEAIERGKETFKLVKALKSGRVVAILIDQDTRVKSRFVNFMGKPAATPIGGTLMAQRTGAAVVPIYITLQPDHSQLLRILPEVEILNTGDEENDLIENTQRISNTTEQAILANPEQWVWMHERWKTQPGEEAPA